jgi:hypothetical protein
MRTDQKVKGQRKTHLLGDFLTSGKRQGQLRPEQQLWRSKWGELEGWAAGMGKRRVQGTLRGWT